MIYPRIIATILLALSPLLALPSLAGTPVEEAPLPSLTIVEQGEMLMKESDFEFAPWTSDTGLGSVQVIQYIGANKSDSEVFKPFTDLLDKHFEPGTINVVSVINMDAAMWGTSGFVMSELKKNKRRYPGAVMVVDEDGIGTREWGLGEGGIALMIVDPQGTVRYFTREAMTPEEIDASLELMKAHLDS